MIVTTHANTPDVVDEVKNEVGEKSVSFLKFILKVFDKSWLNNLIDWLDKKKGGIAIFAILLIVTLFGMYLYFTSIKPSFNELKQLNEKMIVFENQAHKRDSVLNLMHTDIKNGFKDINYRFDNIDSDFGTLIHYVAKDKNDELYLRREILDDHQKIKKPE